MNIHYYSNLPSCCFLIFWKPFCFKDYLSVLARPRAHATNNSYSTCVHLDEMVTASRHRGYLLHLVLDCCLCYFVSSSFSGQFIQFFFNLSRNSNYILILFVFSLNMCVFIVPYYRFFSVFCTRKTFGESFLTNGCLIYYSCVSLTMLAGEKRNLGRRAIHTWVDDVDC